MSRNSSITGTWSDIGLLGRPHFVVGLSLLAVCAAYLIGGLVTGWAVDFPRLINAGGRQVGGDFVVFWSAAAIAHAGAPAQVYDLARLHAQEMATVGGEIPPIPWLYPPTYLLLIWPLGWMPYLAALALWLAVPLAVLMALLKRWAPHPLTPWLVPFFAGVAHCLVIGQNGIISAALLAGGFLCLERRPLIAGILFGLLTYKPQLIVIIGPALLAGRNFRALAAMTTTASALAAASWLAFGTVTWQAFIDAIPVATRILEDGQLLWWAQTVTVFSAARLAGLSVAASYVLQWIVAIAAIAVVSWVWWRRPPLALRASALVTAIPLVTPYSLNYDLAVLALPIAVLAWEGLNNGWRRGELALLAAVWVAPIAGWQLAKHSGVLLTPAIIVLLLVAIVRRVSEWPPAPQWFDKLTMRASSSELVEG